MEWILENFAIVATVVIFIAGIVLRERKRAWFEWANETLFLAFDNAEKRGLLEGLPGKEKLTHYLGIWRRGYVERFGKEPDENMMQFAIDKAAELSKKEKSVRQTVEALSNPK